MNPCNAPFLPTAPNVWAGRDQRTVATDGGFTYLFTINPPEGFGLTTFSYPFTLAVIQEDTRKIIVLVTSETTADTPKGAAFLGAFFGGGHLNFGYSKDWLDEHKFLPEAMKIAKDFVKKCKNSRSSHVNAVVASTIVYL